MYCGRRLQAPVVNGQPPTMPYPDWDCWEKRYCGPGKGILEWAVPEKLPGGTILTPV